MKSQIKSTSINGRARSCESHRYPTSKNPQYPAPKHPATAGTAGTCQKSGTRQISGIRIPKTLSITPSAIQNKIPESRKRIPAIRNPATNREPNKNQPNGKKSLTKQLKTKLTSDKKRTEMIRVMKMQIEVDQSGKMELLSTDTIIACSNEIQYSIKIPKKIKQTIHYNYKNKIKQLKYKLFCVGVYYCIERFLTKSELILIDSEYHGKNNLVKSILLSYIKKRYSDFDKKIIRFGHIGKNSNAHHLALKTFRKEHESNGILTEKQIWSLLK